jgi:hypothetical protein
MRVLIVREMGFRMGVLNCGDFGMGLLELMECLSRRKIVSVEKSD